MQYFDHALPLGLNDRGEQDVMMGEKFSFYTGTGINLIGRSALPTNLKDKVDLKACPTRFNVSNGIPLMLGESVWLTVILYNTLYRGKLIIPERLEFDFDIRTAFPNSEVLEILCTHKRISFRNG